MGPRIDYLTARVAIRFGWLRFAARRLEAVLAGRPDHTGALHYYAWTTLTLGQFEQSLSAYERLAVRFPHNSDVRAGCGSALQNLGRHDEAIAQFNAALDLNPDDLPTQYNLALSLTGVGLLQDALVIYTRLARQQPDNADVVGNLAATLGELGHWTDAVEWGRRAVSLASTATHARNLGIALFELGEYAEAERAFLTTRGLEPGAAETETRFAIAIALQGRHDEAEALLRKLLRQDALSVEVKSSLVTVLGLRGRLDDALDLARELVRLHPRRSHAHEALGWVYLEMGNREAALRSYEVALSLQPDDAHLMKGRSRALAPSEERTANSD